MPDDTPHIQFCFDYISPYSYLAATQMEALEQRLGIPVVWQPVNLPRLIKASGNTPPAMIPNKARYLLKDLKMWADHLEVPFKMIRPGAFDSRPALAATQALEDKDRTRLALVVFESLWSGAVDPTGTGWLEKVVSSNGLPREWVLDDTAPQQLAAVNRITDDILKAGAFGAPTFFIHGLGRRRMFWGIDRLDFLEFEINKAMQR